MFVVEMSIRRGSARSWDHAQLVHEMWADIVTLGVHVFIRRVATDDNIADGPSREDFDGVRHAGAQEVIPVLPKRYCTAQTWEVLHERWEAHGR